MKPRFLSRTTGLGRDERGASLIELALVMPVLVLMLVALGDTARGFAEIYSVQEAVNRTLERAQLGSSSDNYDFLQAEALAAAAHAGVNQPAATVEKWLECNGNKAVKKAWTGSCTEGEQIARYVTLKMVAKFEPIFGGSAFPGANADGTVPISAEASVRVQ
jgi:Flp pilus assembly protein TadG